jgi:hypothetical protein
LRLDADCWALASGVCFTALMLALRDLAVFGFVHDSAVEHEREQARRFDLAGRSNSAPHFGLAQIIIAPRPQRRAPLPRPR